MASYLPPNSYPRENPASPPGSSWNRVLTVKGTLPSLNFGSHIRVNLQPLSTQEDLPTFGRDNEDERQLLSYLDSRRQFLAGLTAQADYLDPQQRASIQELLDRADELTENIGAMYRKWERFPCMQGMQDSQICSWSLDRADTVDAWRARCGELPFQPGKVYDGYDPATGTNRFFTCPAAPGSTPNLDGTTRAQDRQTIRAMAIGILHHIRAAEFALYRLQLHDRAKREFRDEMYADGFGIEPPVEQPPGSPFAQGNLRGFGGGDMDPEDLPDLDDPLYQGVAGLPGAFDDEIPDPFDLPDADGLPGFDPTPGAPDGVTEDKQTKAVKYAAIGLGTATLGVLLYKVLK